MSEPLILLIEDAQADVLLTQRALRKSQIQARLLIAADGVEAWEMIANHGEITLILLDLHLPKINGLHLLEQLRHDESTRSLPIVILTSSELLSDRSKAVEFGADAYVAKPIDPAKLSQIIAALDIDVLKPSSGNEYG
jgi:two-component system, response regulator